MSENNYAALMMKRAPTNSESWNNIKDPGIYPIAAGHPSAPSGEAGVLFVMPPKSGATQDFISTSKKRSTRTLSNGTWSAWSVSLSVGDFGISSTLPALNGVDLNTVQTFGFYVIQNPVNGPAGSNTGAVFLQVMTWQSGTGTAGYRVAQELIGYGQSGSTGNRVWRRTYVGTTWGSWQEFYSEAHKPTAQDTGALPITGGTLTGQLGINNADFINKNGYSTYTGGDGSIHRQAGGLRLTIADTILSELYYNETAGKSAEVSLHNKYGSTDAYFSLRNDGHVSISGSYPTIAFNNGTFYAPDGNINGSVWGGYLSNYITNAVNGRVDWDTFNREVGARATVDWVNANFARKVPDYAEVGSYIYARSDTGSDIWPNTVVSGSTLHAATGDGAIIGDALPGSWRSMGYSTRTNDAHRATLWIRVS